MKIAVPFQPRSRARGVALIVVMVAIFVLVSLVGAFAYFMKVETRLAMNANHETELIWLGRSGVEKARWILAQQLTVGCEPYDSLSQTWAGGPGSACASNSALAGVTLDGELGGGKFTIKITDLERKFNINMADERLIEQALTVVGVDGGDIPGITGAILDWIDPDDLTHIGGAESDDYQQMDPPYYAKNRPIDDLSELLLVRGITKDMYWGSDSTNHALAAFQKTGHFGRADEPTYAVGLVDIFTPLSTGKINVNTASFDDLQIIPGMDENSAAQIVKLRSGPDGADGTEDDTPFHNVGELAMAVNQQLMPQLSRYCDVRSRTFAVEVNADISGYKRTFHAILGRNSPRDVQVLSFYWD